MLRPYQQEACQAVLNQWQEGNHKTLMVLPTGTGKTVVFSKVAEKRVRQGQRVLVLAHRDELLKQAEDKIFKFTNLHCSLEKADETSVGSQNPITVGSVQTLMRKSRLERFPNDYFGTIIVDEAHHAIAKSYQNVLEYFYNADVLGVTATPDRTDKKNLGTYFDSLAYEYTLPQAINEGYLCKIVAQMIPLKIDISNVSTVAGDFNADELGTTLESYLPKIATEMSEYCRGRKTVVFLPLISTSKRFVEILNKAGISAAEVNGKSENRAQILKDFENGKYQVLCNAMLLTEGWDCPAVDCIVCLRPTQSRSLYAQIVGRGLRPYPGKENCLLLDFLWHTQRHTLIKPAHLIAKSDEIAEKITASLQDGNEVDLLDAEDRAERDVVAERERKLKEYLDEASRKKKKTIDPMQYELAIGDEELVNYMPTFAWEMKPPSEKQLQALEKFGISTENVDCCGKASMLLDRLIKRSKSGMTTPRQIKCLTKMGFARASEWSFASANKLITWLSKHHWKVPYEIDTETYMPKV